MATIIDIGFKEGDTVTLKLTSGEEIVGRYEGEDENFIFVSKPLTVIPNPQALGMMQSIISMDMSNSPAVKFKKIHIMVATMTNSHVASHYIKTTTGIDVAPPKGILMG